jgi:hypothetical protein
MIYKNIGKTDKEDQMPLLSISNAIINFTYTEFGNIVMIINNALAR